MSGRVTFPLLAGLLLISGCASFQQASKEYVYEEAFYLTTREDTGQADPTERFNTQRGEPAYGTAMVAIDPEGALSSFAEPQPNRILRQEQLLRREALQQVLSLPEAAFIEALSRYGAGGQAPDEILIFIHGYKRSFGDAVENAARLRYQLAFPGPVVAFSWPSTNAVSGYLADVESLDWSVPALRRLIGAVGDRLPGTQLHFIAHSLGNRALLELLTGILQGDAGLSGVPIGQLVLIAPDVDRDIFMRDIAPVLERLPSRKTLYVSAEDFPLMASGAVFQYPRLGDSRGTPPIINGVETVDVSDAINLFNGHGYYEADQATIEDLYSLIRQNKSAAERPGLVGVETEQGIYWRLQPVE